jgi:hypothetical protein
VLVAEVRALADVGFEVEEEVHRVAVVDVLPFAVANGLLLAIRAVDAPEEGAVDGLGIAGEERDEVDAVEPLFGGVLGGSGEAGTTERAAARKVACKSMVMAICEVTLPLGSFAGQRMTQGTRMPPSHTVAL